MNPEKTIDMSENDAFEMLEAEYEFLGKRLEEFKAWRKAKNEQYERSIEGDEVNHHMEYQKEMMSQ